MAGIGDGTFGKTPDAFIGVQLGRVAREVLEMEAADASASAAQTRRRVSAGVVEQGNDWAMQVFHEFMQERVDLFIGDVALIDPEGKSETLTAGTNRYSRDDRQFVAASAVTKDRRLAARSPGSQNRRNQQKPRFINENDVCIQSVRFFLMRGQSRCFQRWIATSSRSIARRSGF